MKKKHYALTMLAAVILTGFLFWLFHSPRAVIRHVSLVISTNGVAPGMANFRLKIDEPRYIFVSDLFVEVKTLGGWQTYQHLVPDYPRVVSPDAPKNLAVPVPGVKGIWRLRATYGDEMRGPGLFFLKVTVAIRDDRHRMPGPGFGGFSGSNSTISPEMKN